MSQAHDPQGVTIGRLIRTRRKTLGLSQSDLAEKLNLSYQQIQRYENGTCEITVARLAEIAAHCGVPIEYFLKRPPDPKAPSIPTLSDEERRLLKRYAQIHDRGARTIVLQLTQLLRGARFAKDKDRGPRGR